jgi:hypothetical protein
MTAARLAFGLVAVAVFIMLWALAQALGAAFGPPEWLP